MILCVQKPGKGGFFRNPDSCVGRNEKGLVRSTFCAGFGVVGFWTAPVFVVGSGLLCNC